MSLLDQSFIRDRAINFFEKDFLSHGKQKKPRSSQSELPEPSSAGSSSLRLSTFGKIPSLTTSTTNMNGLWNVFTTVRWKRKVSEPPKDACLRKLEVIRQRGAVRAAGNRELTSEVERLCRESIRGDLKERRTEVLARCRGRKEYSLRLSELWQS
ncbi:hypothetical protein RB195_020088 [Necator americanus]|uniref:Uncharacterized protein n=1 Tax=Necator americanus TaxID=51031 RepID=A0ABR1CHS2_NECAM